MLQQAQTAAADAFVKDTTTQAFVKDVIEESKRQPVLVDFWAPWCGPCKQLTPILEKAVRAAKGKVKLAKMNIDEHPAIPGQMGIQSIPAVIAFVNGQPADGFMGALPESQVMAFLERLTKGGIGGEAKDLLKAADAALAEGDAAGAATLYARASRRGQHQYPGAGRTGALLCRNRRARAGEADAGDGAGSQTQRYRRRRGAGRAGIGRTGQDARARLPSWSRRSPPIRSTIRRASISRSRSTAKATGSRRSNT